MRFVIILALILTVALLVTAEEPTFSAPLSVCELLHSRLEYDGKIVSVGGELIGNEHGSLLKGEGCDGSVVSKGYRWFIGIAFTSPGTKEALHKVNFVKDAAAFARYEAIAKTKGYNGKQELIVTFRGMFETYPDLDSRVVTYSDGTMLGAGFGPLGAAPGQLILQSVSTNDIIVRTPTSSPHEHK